MNNGVSADVAQAAGEMFLQEVDKKRTIDAIQLASYASYHGLDGVPVLPPLRGPTYNVYPASQPPASTQPTACGTSSIQPTAAAAAGLLSPLMKGVLLGFGGPALIAAGTFLPGLLGNGKTPISNPPVAISPGPQAVDLGTIGPDGKIIAPKEAP